jgi:hypothetical protein
MADLVANDVFSMEGRRVVVTGGQILLYDPKVSLQTSLLTMFSHCRRKWPRKDDSARISRKRRCLDMYR